MTVHESTDTELNMCDFCDNEVPTCRPVLTGYGTGIGNDNIIVCSSFALRSGMRKPDSIVYAPEMKYKIQDSEVEDGY